MVFFLFLWQHESHEGSGWNNRQLDVWMFYEIPKRLHFFFCPAVGCDRYVDTETIAGFSKLSTVGVTVSVGAVLAHRAVTTVVPGDEEKWEPYMGLFSWKYNRRAF